MEKNETEVAEGQVYMRIGIGEASDGRGEEALAFRVAANLVTLVPDNVIVGVDFDIDPDAEEGECTRDPLVYVDGVTPGQEAEVKTMLDTAYDMACEDSAIGNIADEVDRVRRDVQLLLDRGGSDEQIAQALLSHESCFHNLFEEMPASLTERYDALLLTVGPRLGNIMTAIGIAKAASPQKPASLPEPSN